MEQVVIVDAIRTPMGRSKGGAFRNVRAEDLSAHLMRSLLARNPALEAAALDDIYWGCVQQTLEQGFFISQINANASPNRRSSRALRSLQNRSRAIFAISKRPAI